MKGEYTDDELRRLHGVLYEILGEVDRICCKHNIPYFAIGGTAIGLLYDHAILPWDDDVDIGMTRENYERFLQIAEKELGEKYFLSWYGTEKHTPYYFAKVMKRGTVFVEQICKDIPMRSGIFVDIFPFDRIPDNSALVTVQRRMAEFLFCCLIGKEVWIWRHCKKPEVERPSNRGLIPCAITWTIVKCVPKSLLYHSFVFVEKMFNSCRTKFYNNVMTKTDRITDQQLSRLVKKPFGPIAIYAPDDVEQFLRQNYPKLHRFDEKEQAEVQRHYPYALSFGKEEG